MSDEKLIAIERMAVTNIREVTQTGLFLPIKPSQPKLLLTGERGALHAIKLTGEDAFNQFPISLKTPAEGLFIPDIQVRVDLASMMPASTVSDQSGTLILAGEELSLVVGKVGDNYGDPAPFALSIPIFEGTDSASIAFKTWALGISQDDCFVPLWRNS